MPLEQGHSQEEKDPKLYLVLLQSPKIYRFINRCDRITEGQISG
jgi:hypothetical protein